MFHRSHAPQWLLPAALAAMLLFPASVAPADPSAGRSHIPDALRSAAFEEAGAGAWATWFLDAPSDVLPPPPPDAAATQAELTVLRALVPERTAAALAEARRWDAGPANLPWVNVHLEALGRNLPPPIAARNLATLDLAIYDALVATWHAKSTYARVGPGILDAQLPALAPRATPSYPSEHAAVAGAASRVLAWLYPEDAAYFEGLAAEAARSRLVTGANFPSDVEAGLALGRAVADLAIASRADDGAIEAARSFPIDSIPTGPDAPYGDCTWKPTPTLLEGPWGVTMGSVKPFLLTPEQVEASLAPPPPPCDSNDYLSDHLEVHEHSIQATQQVKDWAAWWHDHGWRDPEGHVTTDSLSTAGTWAPFLRDWILADDLSTPRSARAFALMSAASADAFISTWRSKYEWWSERPVTVLREKEGYADWLPTIETPSFPGYPSGHAANGGAASTILAHLFPSRANIALGWGLDDARAREIVGVHPRFDDDEGRAQGERVAQHYVKWALTDGADEDHIPPRS